MEDFCYTSICGHSEVDADMQEQSTRELCSVVRKMIVDSGTSGMLETSPCPFVAIKELQANESDTVAQAISKLEICSKLGIVGFNATEGIS